MVKGQTHEEFKTFKATDLADAIAEAELFCEGVAAKSLAIVREGLQYYVSIGFRVDQDPYPVKIKASFFNGSSLDFELNEQADRAGDSVICHAIFHGERGITFAFLVHG